MEHEHDILERESGIPPHPERAATAVSVATGAVMGLATGFFASTGPIGMLIGAVIGAAAGGGIAKYVRVRSKRERAKEELLDRESGIGGTPA